MNPEKARKFKNRIHYAKTMSIDEAMRGTRRPVKEKVYDNSIISKEIINGVIETGIKNGKSKLEILLELSSNPRYQQYKQYFRQWINDQYAKKAEIQGKGQKEDEQERG